MTAGKRNFCSDVVRVGQAKQVQEIGVISRSAHTMLELAHTKRSMNVENYVATLIAIEVVFGAVELLGN